MFSTFVIAIYIFFISIVIFVFVYALFNLLLAMLSSFSIPIELLNIDIFKNLLRIFVGKRVKNENVFLSNISLSVFVRWLAVVYILKFLFLPDPDFISNYSFSKKIFTHLIVNLDYQQYSSCQGIKVDEKAAYLTGQNISVAIPDPVQHSYKFKTMKCIVRDSGRNHFNEDE